ncbi:hypothetical protein BH11MYX4_BH11MYX4_46500 [soil metagenome]
MAPPRALFTTIAFLTILGCDKRPVETTTAASAVTPAATPPSTANALPSGAETAQTPTVAAKMADHFSSSVALRDALVKGDLDAFHAAAANLSDKELSANTSDAWKPHLEAMRIAAKRARDAKSVAVGAQALADVGRACAACHEKLGGPKLEVGAPPAPGSGAKPHMARHHWAAARLWDGLMAPSQEAWTKGAEVFTDAPLAPEAIAAQSVPPEVNELAKRAHAYGQQAHAAKDATARAKAVAEVYATCVGCHTKLNVSVKWSRARSTFRPPRSPDSRA